MTNQERMKEPIVSPTLIEILERALSVTKQHDFPAAVERIKALEAEVKSIKAENEAARHDYETANKNWISAIAERDALQLANEE